MLKRSILACLLVALVAVPALADEQLLLNTSMTNGPHCTGAGPSATLYAQWNQALLSTDPVCTLKSSYGGTYCGMDDSLRPFVARSNQIKGCHCVTQYEAMASVIISACGGIVKTATFYVSYHECIQDQ